MHLMMHKPVQEPLSMSPHFSNDQGKLHGKFAQLY